MPWTERMLAMLATGPKNREELIQAGMPLVPPGRAYREAYKRRNSVRRHRGVDQIEMKEPSDADFWSGARGVVYFSLQGLVWRGRVARDGDMFSIARDPVEGGVTFDREVHREAMKRHWVERKVKYGPTGKT